MSDPSRISFASSHTTALIDIATEVETDTGPETETENEMETGIATVTGTKIARATDTERQAKRKKGSSGADADTVIAATTAIAEPALRRRLTLTNPRPSTRKPPSESPSSTPW